MLRVLHVGESKTWGAAAWYLVHPTGTKGGVMAGEPLRSAHGSEISVLMAKRATELGAIQKGSSLDLYTTEGALTMAHHLTLWDPSHALPTLKSVSLQALRFGAVSNGLRAYVSETLARPFGIVIADRARLGDRSAVADLEQMASAVQLSPWTNQELLSILWVEPHDAEVQAAGARVLAPYAVEIGSATPQVAMRAVNSLFGFGPESPLLSVSAFRRALVAGLRNSSVKGEATLGENNNLAYRFENIENGGFSVRAEASAGLQKGKPVSFSLGDFLGLMLTHVLPDAPAFNPWESRAEHDQGIERLAKWLLDDGRDWLAIAKKNPFFRDSS